MTPGKECTEWCDEKTEVGIKELSDSLAECDDVVIYTDVFVMQNRKS